MQSIIKSNLMAKTERDKNTKIKAKHTKLMVQKKNKKKAGEVLRKEKLKAIIKKAKESE
jgi:threonine aldolase